MSGLLPPWSEFEPKPDRAVLDKFYPKSFRHEEVMTPSGKTLDEREKDLATIDRQARQRADPNWKPWVTDLASAYDAYWGSRSPREDQAAYHEILLFGGRDGWAPDPKWRAALARWARRFAGWVEAK
jgi:hypothetical protein